MVFTQEQNFKMNCFALLVVGEHITHRRVDYEKTISNRIAECNVAGSE